MNVTTQDLAGATFNGDVHTAPAIASPEIARCSICFISCRKNNCIRWFIDSLHRELGPDFGGAEIIVIDFYHELHAEEQLHLASLTKRYKWSPPKPNVYQGESRLTRENWWANSSARNSAIALASGEWIVFLDDRSVILPGWAQSVKEAVAGNYIVAGIYEKVHNLIIQDGAVVSFEVKADGQDSRLPYTNGDVTVCGGEWLFGCNFAMPIEWALEVNGFDEDCDSLSFEDCIFGLMLQKQGRPIRLDKRMKILEDRTPDVLEPPFKRQDKGVSPNDKSHAILNMVLHHGRHKAPNYFPEGGLRALREKILSGEPFPQQQIPTSDWFDGQLISEL